MVQQDRGDNGQFQQAVSDDQILTVLETASTPVRTAKQLAQELPIGRHAITNRLGDLKEEGKVERMEVGANAVVWWRHNSAKDARDDSG